MEDTSGYQCPTILGPRCQPRVGEKKTKAGLRVSVTLMTVPQGDSSVVYLKTVTGGQDLRSLCSHALGLRIARGSSRPHEFQVLSNTDVEIVSRWDRLLIFGACNLAALACFVICFALFPVLTLKPRKFAIL